MKPLDYWEMVGQDGKALLWMRGRYDDLVWFFMKGRLAFSDILALSPSEFEQFHYLAIEIEKRKDGETVDDICYRTSSNIALRQKIKCLINEIAF
jgi:lipoprotein NlpI